MGGAQEEVAWPVAVVTSFRTPLRNNLALVCFLSALNLKVLKDTTQKQFSFAVLLSASNLKVLKQP